MCSAIMTDKIKEYWDAIVNYMDDETREKVHRALAPCTEEEFLRAYCAEDEEFEGLLASEFSIEL